jgi:hypothetical protein
MAKEKADIGLERPKNQKDLAEWYVVLHEKNLQEAGVDSILATTDGEVFWNTIKGANACANYCRGRMDANGQPVTFKEFKA